MALAGKRPVAGRTGLLELVVEAEPIAGVDGLDAQGQEQLEEWPAEVKEFEGHGKMKGAGRTGTKGQIEVDVLQEASEELGARIDLGKIVVDGLYVRIGLLLLLFEDDR